MVMLIRVLFSKLSPDPSLISDLGWRALGQILRTREATRGWVQPLSLQCSRFYHTIPDLTTLIDSHCPKYEVQTCFYDRRHFPIWSFPSTSLVSSFVLPKHTPCAPAGLNYYSLPKHITLLFTPPASMHSIPASQYARLSFSRNSDCFLYISMFLWSNKLSTRPKHFGWINNLHS